MNADELKSEISYLIKNQAEIGISVCAILKNDSVPKKIDIDASALGGLKSLFLDSLKDSVTSKDDLTVLDLSTSDERLDAIYLYDLDIPDELTSMEKVATSDDLKPLALDKVDLNSLKVLLIEIGDNDHSIILYKKIAPVNVFQRSGLFLIKHGTRLQKINDDFLRISPNFQLMRVNDELLVFDLETIEKSFGFHEVIKKEATLGVAAIQDKAILENPQTLTKLIDDVKYARRLTKVAKSSPVLLANIPNKNIIEFCKKFPKLAGKIHFNKNGDKILLDTKVSQDLFIKLLMDNFLTSELTEFHYESVAKDAVDVGEGAA